MVPGGIGGIQGTPREPLAFRNPPRPSGVEDPKTSEAGGSTCSRRTGSHSKDSSSQVPFLTSGNQTCDFENARLRDSCTAVQKSAGARCLKMSPADEHERLLIEGKKRLERSVPIPMLAYAAPTCLHSHAHQGKETRREIRTLVHHRHQPMHCDEQQSAEEDEEMVTADPHLIPVQISCEKGQEGCWQDICICICIGGRDHGRNCRCRRSSKPPRTGRRQQCPCGRIRARGYFPSTTRHHRGDEVGGRWNSCCRSLCVAAAADVVVAIDSNSIEWRQRR
jgi:hypothetical protein